MEGRPPLQLRVVTGFIDTDASTDVDTPIDTPMSESSRPCSPALDQLFIGSHMSTLDQDEVSGIPAPHFVVLDDLDDLN